MGEKFVPLYWVKWTGAGRDFASVELFEPDSQMRKINVAEDRFNHRTPLRVPVWQSQPGAAVR